MKIMRLTLALSIVLAALRANAADETFALVVTNNRSQVKHRPNLHYADDDGARFYRMFRGVASEQNLRLLTRFDATSQRLFADLEKKTRPPTRKQLAKAIAQIKRGVDAAKKRGHRTLFYFVFAGHGHVHKGKGYLELEDGRLGPTDLEKMVLDQVKANVVHLMLDSCNSFFVINPRKPGGKRFATPKDMTHGFSKRYPHVGVFLSTSAAGEVYEWSEVQGGIFSHEVRSGLSGAADADGNGRVSYDELRSFVAVANKQVSNEQYRPKVFARGPWKKGRATLLTYRWARGTRLRLARSQLRMWVRDAQGTRLIDLHKEHGEALEIVLPPGGGPYTVQVERSSSGKKKGRPTLHEYALNEQKVELAALQARPVTAQARGPEALFAQLFRSPFGQRAHRSESRRQQADERLVFGLSWRDEVRMRHYLSALSRADRQDRLMNAGVFMGIGALFGAVGASAIPQLDSENTTGQAITYAWIGTSAALVGVGVYNLLRRSEGEKAYATFDAAMRQPGAQRDLVVARTERHLHDMAARERRMRKIAAGFGFACGGAQIITAIAMGIRDAQPGVEVESLAYIATLGTGALFLGLGTAMLLIETPMERMLRLYYDDPDLRVNLSVAPMPGGGAFAISGTF